MAGNDDKNKSSGKEDKPTSAATQQKPQFVPTPVMKVRAQLVPKKNSD